jgi:rhomboid protease GluP
VSEEIVFWKLAHYFVNDENFRILHISKDQKELWLENPDSKQSPLIRLVNYELDWSNWIERDLQVAGMNGEKIRKQKWKKSLHILNIYVSPYPPVDDYHYKLNQLKQFDQTHIQTLIISRTTLTEAIEAFKPYTSMEKIKLLLQDSYSGGLEDIETIKRATIQLSKRKVKEELSIFSYGKPIITYSFILIQLIMFLLLEISGGSENTSTLIQFGAKFNPLIIEGEWWRFFAPIFLHIGLLHLFMNTLGLYFLGSAVEKIYGSIRFFWIYIFAGLIGSIASFTFSPNLSAGASGAIYGCFGALLYLGFIYPKLFFRTLGMNVIVILLLNIVLSFNISNIDQAGHLGGLVGGFVAVGIVHFPKKKKILSQFLFLLFGVILTTSLLFIGFNKPQQIQSEASILQLAQEYVKEQQFDKAYSLLTKYDDQSKEHSEHFFFQLSYVEIQKGMLNEAEAHLIQAIEINPSYHEAHFNLAIIFLQRQEVEKAKQHINIAVQLDPSNEKYKEILSSINR